MKPVGTLCNVKEVGSWLRSNRNQVLLIDGGGVLFNNVTERSPFFHRVAVTCNVKEEQIRLKYERLDKQFETGCLDVLEVLSRSLIELRGRPLDAAEAVAVQAQYQESVRLNAVVFNAIATAAKSGENVLVFANNEAERWDRLKDAVFQHLSLFDKIASSWRVRACKPTPEYFTKLDQLLFPRVRAEWHILDDSAAVIARSIEEGLQGTLYAAGVG